MKKRPECIHRVDFFCSQAEGTNPVACDDLLDANKCPANKRWRRYS